MSCWGSGSVGQLGNGDFSDRTTPTPTNSLGLNRSAIAISAGHFHTCVILDNGEVSCWGQDASGRLGNGGTSTINTPTLTASLGDGRTAVSISSGSLHTCAVLDNGNVSCWGSGLRGGLGNGDTASRYIPTPTASLGDGRTAVSISSGSLHTCAVLDNGEISC